MSNGLPRSGYGARYAGIRPSQNPKRPGRKSSFGLPLDRVRRDDGHRDCLAACHRKGRAESKWRAGLHQRLTLFGMDHPEREAPPPSPPVGWAQTSDFPPGFEHKPLSRREIIGIISVVCLAIAGVLNVIGVYQTGNSSRAAFPTSQQPGLTDSLAQFVVTDVLASADHQLASGATSFKAVTIGSLNAGNAPYRVEGGPVSGIGKGSVSLCADGAACQELVVASQAQVGGTCWVGKSMVESASPSTIEMFGWTPKAPTCSSGSAESPVEPASGWQRGFPDLLR